MIKLGTVLNQLFDDIVQAKHYANGISKSLLTEYQKDPVLKHIPAPGLALKELSFALKFAFVAKEVQKVSESLAKSFFLENISPSITEAFTNSINDRNLIEPLKKTLKDAFESLNNPDDFNLTEAMKGDPEKSILSFLKVSQDIYNLLPIDMRRKLSPSTDILKVIEDKTRKDLPHYLSKFRLQLPNPNPNGLALTLDKDDLQSLSSPTIQEVKFVLGAEDLKLLDSPTNSNPEVRAMVNYIDLNVPLVLKETLGSLLGSVVDAQVSSANASIDFIRQIGLLPKKEGEKAQELETIKFKY